MLLQYKYSKKNKSLDHFNKKSPAKKFRRASTGKMEGGNQ
jgi:hypothetical protein